MASARYLKPTYAKSLITIEKKIKTNNEMLIRKRIDYLSCMFFSMIITVEFHCFLFLNQIRVNAEE